MWCSNCHQDVPGVAHAATGRLVCSQCQRPMAAGRKAPSSPICDEGIELAEQVATRKRAAPPVRTDDWTVRQRARKLDRALRRPLHVTSSSATTTPFGARRFDPPQHLLDHYERALTPAITTSETTPPQIRRSRATAGQVLAWLIVAGGTITLLAGIGLLGWSHSANQMQHWNLALSLALGGQGALILGL